MTEDSGPKVSSDDSAVPSDASQTRQRYKILLHARFYAHCYSVDTLIKRFLVEVESVRR